MKSLILTILISVSLFAQEATTVSRGSGSYTYDVTTGTNQIVNGDLYLYGNFTRTLTDTGSYSFHFYIVWKYTNGTYDSTRTLALNIDNPLQDTTGTYYCSVLYRLKNGTWAWEKGADSTFTIGTTMSAGTYITTANGNYWTTQDGKYITVE